MRNSGNTAVVLTLLFLLSACATTGHEAAQSLRTERQALYKFAYADCLFQYFKKKGYDLQDIRAISGGYLETSSIPVKTFRDITQLVKSYRPELRTKQNIDPALYKCFFLEESEGLNQIISDS
jgi:hypothetical protein